MTDRYVEQINVFVNVSTDFILGRKKVVSETNIDKINLTLSELLRSVGDVKDKLFKDDNDGLWKIERKVGEIVFDGSESWSMQSNPSYGEGHRFTVKVSDSTSITIRTPIKSSHFVSSTVGDSKVNGAFLWGGQIFIYPSASIATTVNQLKSWLDTNNVEFFYLLDSFKTETLDQEIQDKLNSLLKDGVYYND